MPFMEPEGLLCSQELAIGPYPELADSGHAALLYHPF
jgi:hypothetical protein